MEDGVRKTYFWIKGEVEKEAAKVVDISAFASSKLVVQSLESLSNLVDGKQARPQDQSDSPDKVAYVTGRAQ